nr:hypothetical protein [Tanacetum cinerariifolium]
VDVVPLVPKLRKNRTAHIDYIKHTLEEAATLRELVENERLLSLLNTSLTYACKYTRQIQELLMILQQTCPRITDLGTNLVAVTPKNQTQQIRRTAHITKSEKTYVATSPSSNIDSNTPVLSSTRVALSSRVQSKEQCDDLINKVNLKSVEVADLNASLQEKVLVITALKEQLKGKAVLTKVVSLNPIDPALLQVDVVPLVPKLGKNRTAYIDYIRHTQEEVATLRELIESERLLSPLNTSLTYASLVSSASGSKSQDNTKKNRIRRTQKKAKETELEDHPRNVKSILNKASVVDSRATLSVIKYVSNVNSILKYASCNGCLFFDNHDACVVAYINSVNASRKSKSWISDLARQTDARSSFNELLDTPIDFSNFIMNQLNVDTLTPALLAGPTYELMRGSCTSLTELEYHFEEVYKVTTDQLDWVNPEGQQYLHNLLQPLPLIPDNRGRRVIPFYHFINNDLEYLRG